MPYRSLLTVVDIDAHLPVAADRMAQIALRSRLLSALALEILTGVVPGMPPIVNAMLARAKSRVAWGPALVPTLPLTGSVVVTTLVDLSRFADVFEAIGIRCWPAARWEAVPIAPSAAAADPQATDWPLHHTHARAAGADPAGRVVVGLLDSTMPRSRWTGLNITDYRPFHPPDTAVVESWHSSGCAFLLVDPIHGVAPGLELVLAAVLTMGEPWKPKGDPADAIRGLEWLLQWERDGRRIDVVNASIDLIDQREEAFSDCLRNARKAGRAPAVVAAAGNHAGSESPRIGIPGSINEVIAVGNIDHNGAVAEASGWRPADPALGRNAKPDLVAPGTSIWTINQQGEPGRCEGTSLAAPFVAGTLARLIAAGQTPGDATRTLLSEMVRPQRGPRVGRGELWVS